MRNAIYEYITVDGVKVYPNTVYNKVKRDHDTKVKYIYDDFFSKKYIVIKTIKKNITLYGSKGVKYTHVVKEACL